MTIAVPVTQFEAANHEGEEDPLLRLRGENLALQSILYGLCMGLSHMSELHREAVIQAMDYAVRTPTAMELSRNGQRSEAQAFNETISLLRLAIFERFRAVG